MINFTYLGGRRRYISNFDIFTFLNDVSSGLSVYGFTELKHGRDILADFDGTIKVKGDNIDELVLVCKEFQGLGLPLPSKQVLRMWNELIFDLYPVDSIIEILLAGEVRGSGLICQAGQRLYGGHLMINRLGVQLSASLTAIEIQSQLIEDLNLGLQALMAIISNLENAGLVAEGENKWSWKLTLKPGMLYEEVYNGREK